ncbi:MAG TPA: serine hydrolase [Symbiobacteriaceae bacterium]|nr:serine hydrolase [Symbiobacteriaceae bacterium]
MTLSARIDDFEAYARQVLDRYLCPGLAVGLAQKGELTYFKGFGFRNVEHQLPMTPDTVMGIGSCTKSFTCVAVMQLQEAGRLSVHDPVVRYLPEFRLPDQAHARAVTLHHLMTHTAGLPPLPTLLHAMVRSMKADPALKVGSALDGVKPIQTVEEMMDLIAATRFELLGPPGTRFSYSNDGFALLGAVVERVSGMPLARYIKEQILLPAGMTRTTLVTADLESLTDVALLYSTRRGEDGEPEVGPAPGWWEISPMEAAGHMRSTVGDMLRYCELYRTGGLVGGARILQPESVRAMTTPYFEYLPGLFYGYGLQIVPDYHGLSLIEHGGAIKGVSAQFSVMPGRQLTGVALTNLAGVPSADILLSAMNAAAGLPLEARRTEPAPYDCPPAELARYEGEFPTTEGVPGVFSVRVEEGALVARSAGGLEPMPPVTLIPAGPHRFYYRTKDSTTHVRFHFGSDGKVWAVSIGLRMLRKNVTFCD